MDSENTLKKKTEESIMGQDKMRQEDRRQNIRTNYM